MSAVPNAAVERGLGDEILALIAQLYPICRSITGNGFRETMRTLGELIPLEIHEVPTGTQVLDWTVPREWNITDAYVKDSSGRRVIDFRSSNLHVVNYSVPVRARMRLSELRPHLHSLPDHPDWIPYRTTYYHESWGFCLRHRDLTALDDGEYDVCIDSTLEAGHLTYGECFLPGESDGEILVSTHACHPSLANDNLSGVTIAAFLAREIASRRRRLSYRFLFVPGTIGAITWLARNEEDLPRIQHGLVLTCVGDAGHPTYKRSRQGTASVDRAFEHVLARSEGPYAVEDFMPWGYDERQYCSPGFDLPVGCLMRTPHGRFPEYHTSADDLALVHPDALAHSFATVRAAFEILDEGRVLRRVDGRGEPQLAKHGLDRAIAAHADPPAFQLALLWVLNLADGEHDLLAIADRAELPFSAVLEAARLLEDHALIVAAE